MNREQTSRPKRVGIVFAGGPAPAGNAVIAVAASAFRRRGAEVVGILNGFATLESDRDSPLEAGRDFRTIEDRDLPGLRNERGIVIGTSRSRPGRGVATVADLDDREKTKPLDNVYRGLVELGLDALISIGGDGTLRTSNCLFEYQRRLPPDAKRVRIVHVPKTIDNDYRGIDFTFGFFTAVGVIAEELRSLRADAKATRSYFIAETMGRRAGWLAYGAAIAGEAHMVIGVEDVVGELALGAASRPPQTNGGSVRPGEGRLDLDALADRIVKLIVTREKRGKEYGTVVLAEGLVTLLPEEEGDKAREHFSLNQRGIAKLVAARVATRYQALTGHSKKVTGIQLGYESRCAAPHAFDVLLGSQLGLGAYRALAEESLDGQMVSVSGQLELKYVPFSELIDGVTLQTHVRFIDRGSDFHRLAHDLGTRI
jgi:6-phosphofructokinase 1